MMYCLKSLNDTHLIQENPGNAPFQHEQVEKKSNIHRIILFHEMIIVGYMTLKTEQGTSCRADCR